MCNKKLEVLNNFLNRLQDENTEYKWNDITVCNCGNLLQSIGYSWTEVEKIVPTYTFIMDLNNEITEKYKELESEMEDKYFDSFQTDGAYIYLFSLYQEPICELTQLPFSTVVNELIGYGFTLQELKDLEFLSDKRFTNKKLKFNNKESLIEYVKNWIKYEETITQNIKVNNSVQQSVTI